MLELDEARRAARMKVVEGRLRVVPDFPRPGIMFEDVTPVVADREAFSAAVSAMVEGALGMDRPTILLGMEARGFVFGAAMASVMGAGLLLARKPGKLPVVGARVEYELEYGRAVLELGEAGVRGSRVVVVDDLLATGGTAVAAAELVGRLGGEVVGYVFLVELAALGGRGRLGAPVWSGVVR